MAVVGVAGHSGGVLWQAWTLGRLSQGVEPRFPHRGALPLSVAPLLLSTLHTTAAASVQSVHLQHKMKIKTHHPPNLWLPFSYCHTKLHVLICRPGRSTDIFGFAKVTWLWWPFKSVWLQTSVSYWRTSNDFLKVLIKSVRRFISYLASKTFDYIVNENVNMHNCLVLRTWISWGSVWAAATSNIWVNIWNTDLEPFWWFLRSVGCGSHLKLCWLLNLISSTVFAGL